MLFYCLKCSKNMESKNPKVVKGNRGKLMLSSKRAVCGSKKSKTELHRCSHKKMF